MANLNLQALIDQVLGITREAWDMKKRKLDEGLSGHEQTQLRNNKIDDELLKQRGAQELQEQGNEASLARQGLVNAGDMEKQREVNAGELARKQLGLDFNREELEFNKRKHDVENIRDYYKIDVDAKSAKYTGDTERVKGASAIAGDQTIPLEQRQPFIDFLKSYITAEKPSPGARPTLTEEAPAAIPAASPAAAKPAFSLNDLTEPVGTAIVQGVIGKNPPNDFNDFKITNPAATPTAPQNTTPSTPATGLGGSIGRGWYGFTHPDEPTRFNGVPSPIRKATDKIVFDTAPKAVANTAIGAVRGVQDFGSNTVLGYEQRKAEEEAKKKRKALY